MPERSQIQQVTDQNLYSVEIYPGLHFFDQFNPNIEFEKWAAVRVSSEVKVPDSMELLIIPAGLYAVFSYKGTSANVPNFMQYVFGTWMLKSKYQLDDRPHFALMGEKYKNNDPDSEEDFWVPVKPK